MQIEVCKDELRLLIRENAQQIVWALAAGSPTPEDKEVLDRVEHLQKLSQQLLNGKDEDEFTI